MNKRILILLLLFYSCGQGQKEQQRSESLTKDSSQTSFKVQLSDKFIEDTIFSLAEVRQKNRLVDSLTNHEHGVSLIIEKPTAQEKDYQIRVGYNSEQRFETYYNFYMNPRTKQITVDDVISAERLTLEEWRKDKN